MRFVLRTVLAVAAGMAVAVALIVAVEWLSSVVHPFPPNFDGNIPAHVKRYPQWALALVVVLWGATGAAAAWVASRIGSRLAGGIIAVVLLAALLFNLSMLPYALWFKVVMPVALALGCFVGMRQATRRKA